MTLPQLGSKAGVGFSHISVVERGEKQPGSEILQAICQAMDVPLSVILSDAADEIELHEMASVLVA